MTGFQILGSAMLAALFIGLIVLASFDLGLKQALIGTVVVVAGTAFVAVAALLIGGAIP